MSRASHSSPAPLELREEGRHAHRTLRILTPVFGGGVEAGVRDPITPVRPSGVRGQLRHWWRFACGRGISDDTFRHREGLLWGAARDEDSDLGKGWVSLEVDTTKLGAAKKVDVFRADKPKYPIKGMEDIGYGAFPLQPAQGSNQPAKALSSYNGTFEIHLRANPASDALQRSFAEAWPDAEDPMAAAWEEVQRALHLWSNFGGVGGRTRRGFGAVEPISDQPEWEKWKGQFERIACRNSSKDVNKAHSDALRRLKSFRQGVGIGRNKGNQPNRPGRSRWPEPDAIRRISKSNSPQHRPEHPAGNIFPRAAFGLPLITHFKDRNEPRDSTLQPKGGSRLPSPLLLRPLRLPGGRYAAAAILLEKPDIKELEIAIGRHSTPVRGVLTSDQVDQIKPLRENRDSKHPTSVLHTFLNFFER